MNIRYLVDSNLLLYAHHRLFEQHHAAARDWLSQQLSQEGIAMPWLVAFGFVRISLNRHLFATPMTVAEAWCTVTAMLDTRRVWLLEPGARHRQILESLMSQLGRDEGDLTDAHLAALAIEHRLTLCSADTGFARFESAGLRWKNPLKP